MELSPSYSGRGPEGLPRGTVLSARQVARQLGHPLAALDDSALDEPLVEYDYGDGWPQLDSATLTYAQPAVCVETVLRARNPRQLDQAARSALSGFRLDDESDQAVPLDMDTWMQCVLDEGAALPTRSDAAGVTINGTPFARVVVEDGTYQAWALETEQVQVTVAGRHEHLESVVLRWWQPALIG